MSRRSLVVWLCGGVLVIGAAATAAAPARAGVELAPKCLEVGVGTGFAGAVARGLEEGIAAQRAAGYVNLAPVLLQNNRALVCGW